MSKRSNAMISNVKSSVSILKKLKIIFSLKINFQFFKITEFCYHSIIKTYTLHRTLRNFNSILFL